MTLTGLPLATLLGVAGAVFAATALLYVLKLRRRPVAVPFSPIWQKVLRDKDASQLFSRLKSLLSLLLQLVLIGLVLLALGDPRPAAGSPDARHVVVLVDTSASMAAVDVEPSRLEQARLRVLELVQGLGSADRMLVARMDARTAPLSTMTGEPAELTEALAVLSASDTRADLDRGLAFARDVLRGATHPEIVVVSDGALEGPAISREELGGVPVRFLPVGKTGSNVAVTGFAVRRYPLDASRVEVMLEVTSTAEEALEVELTLLGDGAPIDVSRLSLQPGERLPRFYSDLGGASRTLEARIRLGSGRRDDLPADDRAYALVPERRRARVQVVTTGNTYLEAALLLDEYLDVTTVSPARYSRDAAHDVTIFDGVAPPRPRTGGALYLGPPAEGSPVKVGKALAGFGFDTWDKKSPLLRFMAVENVQVARGNALEPERGDTVVGASEGRPFLVSGKREGLPFVAVGFDPRESDLVLRTAWPLFVLNVIHSFSESDSTYVSGYRTGEVWHVPVAEGATLARVREPGGRVLEVPVENGRAVLFGERAGFYEVRAGAEDARPTTIAGNLSDPLESQITPKAELVVAGEAARAIEGFTVGVRREIWGLLLAAAVLLSLFEWVAYHRRLTV